MSDESAPRDEPKTLLEVVRQRTSAWWLAGDQGISGGEFVKRLLERLVGDSQGSGSD